jgi:dipeptidyl aminopeptidase/acylaminoacyl peptidase
MKIFIVGLVTVALAVLIITVTIGRKNSTVNSVKNEISTLVGGNTKAPSASPISINYLRTLDITSDGIKIEEELADGSNYKKYIASYLSEGNKVYGLLTVPDEAMPTGGYPAIVFNHGYIPPTQYETTKGYVAYVDYLARNGFVVFKIDFRGNGKSEGDPSGSYFSSAYTIDAISAVKSLEKYEKVNPSRIGMWGHSMAGNATLRSMLVSGDIKAGVIWSGAVYSYQDFAKYGITDNSYVHKPDVTKEGQGQSNRETSPEIQKIRSDPGSIDFQNDFWKSISLTSNIKYLSAPLQIHHVKSDPVVNVGYARDLVSVLKENSKTYEYFEYDGGGHNISSPYFETAMERTVNFFKDNL